MAAKRWKCVKKHEPTQMCYGCVVKYQNPDKRCGHPAARRDDEGASGSDRRQAA